MKIALLMILLILIVIIKYSKNFNLKKLFPFISTLLFSRISFQLTLKDFKTYDDYLQNLNSKKRKGLKKIEENEINKIKIKQSKFKNVYIKYLWKFYSEKYNNLFTKLFNIVLAILVFITNELKYWEYYDKDTDKFLGWSSFFISDGIYYDFISSPNNFKISTIGINSIKYCIDNKINIIDFGPTNGKLKMSKFNAEMVDI